MSKFLQATNLTRSDSTATSVFQNCPVIHCGILFSSLSKLCLSVGLAYLNGWHFQPLVSSHKVVSLIRWWSIYSAIFILVEVFTACLTSDMVMTLYCSFRDIDSFFGASLTELSIQVSNSRHFGNGTNRHQDTLAPVWDISVPRQIDTRTIRHLN